MSVMTIPEAWYGQDRMLTVEDMENMPRPGPGFTIGTGRRTSTKASASPLTGSSNRTWIAPS
jgi:hypothetical protein